MKKSIIVILMLLTAIPALYAEWVYVCKSRDEEVYVDDARIRKIPKGKVRCWMKYFYTNQAERERLKSIFDLERMPSYDITCVEFDVENEEYEMLEATYYDIEREIISTIDSMPTEHNLIYPGSIMEAVYECVMDNLNSKKK